MCSVRPGLGCGAFVLVVKLELYGGISDCRELFIMKWGCFICWSLAGGIYNQSAALNMLKLSNSFWELLAKLFTNLYNSFLVSYHNKLLNSTISSWIFKNDKTASDSKSLWQHVTTARCVNKARPELNKILYEECQHCTEFYGFCWIFEDWNRVFGIWNCQKVRQLLFFLDKSSLNRTCDKIAWSRWYMDQKYCFLVIHVVNLY